MALNLIFEITMTDNRTLMNQNLNWILILIKIINVYMRRITVKCSISWELEMTQIHVLFEWQLTQDKF